MRFPRPALALDWLVVSAGVPRITYGGKALIAKVA